MDKAKILSRISFSGKEILSGNPQVLTEAKKKALAKYKRNLAIAGVVGATAVGNGIYHSVKSD